MAPNNAGCMMLAGLSLWLQKDRGDQFFSPVSRLAAKTFAVIVSIAGSITLGEHLFHCNLGIDRLLLLRAPAGQIADANTLMSPITAAALLLISFALQAIDLRTRRKAWPSQFLCLGAAILNLVGLCGLVLGTSITHTTVAPPTIVCFSLLTGGILCSRPGWAAGGLLVDSSRGARFSRTVLPIALLTLGLVFWLISKPLLNGLSLTWVELSAMVIVSGALVTTFVLLASSIVDQDEIDRRQIEEGQQLIPGQSNLLPTRIQEPVDDELLRRKVTLGLLLAVILTAVLGFLSWRMAQQAEEYSRWIDRANESSTMIKDTLLRLLDVESGGRGFAETGSQQYLRSYQSGQRMLAEDLRRLQFLIADPVQLQRLKALASRAGIAAEAVRSIVVERKQSDSLPPQALFQREKQSMDAVRGAITEMRIAEEQILDQRARTSRATRRFNRAVISLGSVLDIIFLSFAATMVNREIGISTRARGQLKALNADLERRVAERTEAAQQSLSCAEQALKQLEQQQFALDQHAIVAITDVQGCITYVNDKFCAICGYTREELVGRNHRIVNSGYHSREFFEEMYRDVASGKVWHGEIRNRAKDGTFYWVDTTIVPFMEEGNPRQYVAIRADITARKQAADDLLKLHQQVAARNEELEEQTAELQRTREELEQRVIMRTADLAKSNQTLATSNIELQQFAYVASHDLQSPLRSISGFVQLLQMEYGDKLDEEGRGYIRRAVLAISRMQTLIRDLLSYSHIESRSRPFAPVSLLDVFHGSLLLLDSSIRESGGQVTCGELPVVFGDSSQLAQLMQNLIGNGLKYHGTEPPRVHVCAERATNRNEWIVSVRDNGIGIDPKYFGYVFEIFKRLHDQKEYPGTGIGLAVCRRVVELHGGAIWVESEPGHGSTFRFSISADAAKPTGKTNTTDQTNGQQSYEHEAR